MPSHERFVVVHRARSSMEAGLVRLILDSAGIMAMVPDENSPLPGVDLTPLDGDYSGMGCDVLVPVEDLERARAAIADAREAGRLAAETDSSEEQSQPEEGEAP